MFIIEKFIMNKIKSEFYINAVKYENLIDDDKILADKILDLLKDDLELINLYDGCFVNFITKHPKYRLSIQSDYTDDITSKFFIAFSKARKE